MFLVCRKRERDPVYTREYSFHCVAGHSLLQSASIVVIWSYLRRSIARELFGVACCKEVDRRRGILAFLTVVGDGVLQICSL